jgi:hypothetical protein
MKMFGFAAVLTGMLLASLAARRRVRHYPAPGLTDSDRRYGIDDFVDGLD